MHNPSCFIFSALAVGKLCISRLSTWILLLWCFNSLNIKSKVNYKVYTPAKIAMLCLELFFFEHNTLTEYRGKKCKPRLNSRFGFQTNQMKPCPWVSFWYILWFLVIATCGSLKHLEDAVGLSEFVSWICTAVASVVVTTI